MIFPGFPGRVGTVKARLEFFQSLKLYIGPSKSESLKNFSCPPSFSRPHIIFPGFQVSSRFPGREGTLPTISTFSFD